ncbi:MAG TPA: SulP family inorganic anion transporter [Gemmatimonadaceae bacterium]|jgi:SulP family sulfate permease|nr:SulP family inorganic anion transporter [Gemmatimonadaceae bacterium]
MSDRSGLIFAPKLLTTLRGYTRAQLIADLGAGVIVGIVALPLAIAFAIASGVTPDRGLYTAIIAGFLISALGGSRVQIGGPTGAFVVIVYGIVQRYGLDGLTVATIMAGVILIALGLLKLGSTMRFIPFPIITGFTSGIAVIIFSGEIKDLLGLHMGDVPAHFLEKWLAYSQHVTSINSYAIAISAGTIAILVLWPVVSRRIPGPLIALLAATAVVQIFHLPVETIGSRFGAINATFPPFHLPTVSIRGFADLAQPAIAIALLGGIESLLSAVVADGMIGGQHRPDTELIAQGIANIVTPLFGGIPATGAIARTATNAKNGGRTPVAGMTHAVTLLAITIFIGKWAALIPMACLAGILTIVCYHMSEWRTFRAELRSPRSDVAVLLVTFGLTVIVSLVVAIEVGMVLAAFLFMRRMAEVAGVSVSSSDETPGGDTMNVATGRDIQIYEINGPLFFGAAAAFKEALSDIAQRPRVIILRMGRVPAIDATGLRTLADIVHRFRREGTLVILSELHPQPRVALERSPVMDDIGEENVAGTQADAVALAGEYIAVQNAIHASR